MRPMYYQHSEWYGGIWWQADDFVSVKLEDILGLTSVDIDSCDLDLPTDESLRSNTVSGISVSIWLIIICANCVQCALNQLINKTSVYQRYNYTAYGVEFTIKNQMK